MTKYLLIVLVFLGLTACSSIQEKVVTEEVYVEKIPLNLQMPKSFEWKDFEVIVVTEENFDDVIQELKVNGKSLALFAFDTDSYEALTLNVTEMKRYMSEQKVIILEYKNYYENKEK